MRAIIKGKYVGLVTIDFSADENDSSLLPFTQLQETIKKDLSGIIKELLEDEVGDIATVNIEQMFADLYILND